MRVAIVLALFLGLAAPLGADPLPKGNVQDIDKNKIKGPAKPMEMVTTCFDHLAYPLANNGYFTSDSKTLFLLASAGRLKKRGGKSGGGELTRYVLHRLDLETKKITTELGLSHKRGAHLLTFGEPVAGIQAVVFDGTEKDCSMGSAGIIGVSFKSGANAVRDSGEYVLVPGAKGSVLVDQRKGRLTETDLVTFQTRLLAKIPQGERPLYYDSSRKTLVTFKVTDSNRGLVRYKVLATKLDARRKLAIEAKDRVLRDGDAFGFLVTDTVNHQLLVRQVPEWTGEQMSLQETSIKLPAAIKAQDALFVPHFARDYLAVVGKNDQFRRKWAGILIYELGEGKLLHRMQAGKGRYFEYSGFSPDGSVFIAEAVTMGGLTRALHVYDFATKKQLEYEITN